jgi:transcriptional regulator with XRE-family HTH domain
MARVSIPSSRRNGAPKALNGARAISPTRNGAAESAADTDFIGRHLCDRVRELRQKREWTLEQLAAASGVSRSMLSQIERNEVNPTIGVAYRIAQSFGISLATLVDAPDHTPTIDVIRLADRTFHYRTGRDVRLRSITPEHLERDVEFFEVALQPGAALKSVPHFTGTREFASVLRGRVRVRSGEELTILSRGDAAHYPADVPHVIENIGKVPALLFLVEIYRSAHS